MATKKYLSYDRLAEYDALIKQEIVSAVSAKADKTHSHNDLYYTEAEIDSKISTINSSISNITNGTTTVKDAQHATNADNATSANDADKLGGQLPSYYAKASDIPTGALAKKNSVSESDLDNALAEKVNAAAEGNHSHSNKSVLDGITSTKVSNWDSAEANAKAYADTAASNAATKVKNDLLNGAGTAYDTLKELGDLIDDNADAIEALEAIASGKADATHSHAISEVTGLQSALDGKADASHGTHVTYSTTAPVMDGTASAGSAATVARSDHKHPTDTSRASKTEFDTHTSNTTVHITSTERTNWGTAYTHSQAAHAPSNAQANIIESIKVNGTAQTISSKAVNITVPTDNSQLANGAGYITASAISNKADKSTTLSGYGITNAYTKSEVDAKTIVDSTLSSSSTNPVQNKVVNSAISTLTSSVSANTSSISTHNTAISNLQTSIAEFTEITSAEIQALFA